ncbi:hypothetical protein GIW70_25290 [Pseudomonas syringae]|nr:hypothetical protein [Pseudomonas syringae]MCF5071492.1 hypothetical protein [Pseudomonas syringae]
MSSKAGDTPPEKQSLSTLRRHRRASGKRLRLLLREYGISPTGFAEFLVVTPACITNWFVRGVPRHRLGEFSRLLSVNERWLAIGEGIRHPCFDPPVRKN